MSRAVYEIKVRGVVPPGLLEDFGAHLVAADERTTTISVDLPDQSALHGLLNALRQAGLEFVDVHRDRAVG